MVRCLPIALVLILATGQAQARVLLIDASERAGEAAPWLAEVGRQLQVELDHGVTGPLVPTDPAASAPAPQDHRDIEQLLESVASQLDGFSFDAAVRTLRRAEDQLADVHDPQIGPLRVRAHELGAALAIARGEDDAWPPHVAAIAALAPWWRVPRGLLTPEATALLEQTATAVAREGAQLQLAHLPEGTQVRVDGFDLEPDADAVWVIAGDHLVVVQRPGFLPRVLRPAVMSGQEWAVPVADQLDLREGPRARMRTSISGSVPGDLETILVQAARHADATLVLVADARAGDPSDTARVAVFDPRTGVWTPAPGAEAVEAAVSRTAALIAAPDARVAPGVVPLAALSLGGAARVVVPEDLGVAGGGGLHVSGEVGIRVAQRFDLAIVAGLDLAGPAATVAMVERVPALVTQRTDLVRVGLEAAPRLPVGGRAWLRIGGSGGLAFGGLAVAVGDARQVERGLGAWFAPEVGLELRAAPHVTVGPVVRYVHAFVPLAAGEQVMDGTASSQALRHVEIALRIGAARSARPAGGDRDR